MEILDAIKPANSVMVLLFKTASYVVMIYHFWLEVNAIQIVHHMHLTIWRMLSSSKRKNGMLLIALMIALLVFILIKLLISALNAILIARLAIDQRFVLAWLVNQLNISMKDFAYRIVLNLIIRIIFPLTNVRKLVLLSSWRLKFRVWDIN